MAAQAVSDSDGGNRDITPSPLSFVPVPRDQLVDGAKYLVQIIDGPYNHNLLTGYYNADNDFFIKSVFDSDGYTFLFNGIAYKNVAEVGN